MRVSTSTHRSQRAPERFCDRGLGSLVGGLVHDALNSTQSMTKADFATSAMLDPLGPRSRSQDGGPLEDELWWSNRLRCRRPNKLPWPRCRRFARTAPWMPQLEAPQRLLEPSASRLIAPSECSVRPARSRPGATEQEPSEGLSAIAAPVRDRRGRVVTAVNASIPDSDRVRQHEEPPPLRWLCCAPLRRSAWTCTPVT